MGDSGVLVAATVGSGTAVGVAALVLGGLVGSGLSGAVGVGNGCVDVGTGVASAPVALLMVGEGAGGAGSAAQATIRAMTAQARAMLNFTDNSPHRIGAWADATKAALIPRPVETVHDPAEGFGVLLVVTVVLGPGRGHAGGIALSLVAAGPVVVADFCSRRRATRSGASLWGGSPSYHWATALVGCL